MVADAVTDGTDGKANGESGVTSDATVGAARHPRIDCIDGCRFFLVLPLIIGHFIRFGTSNQRLLKVLTQQNVFIAGLFIISGYVTGYKNTNLRDLGCEQAMMERPELWFWKKVMGYYPLHFLVSVLFAPMFVSIDMWTQSSRRTTALHAALNFSLMQAWFPTEAKIWNPPAWVLSAFTFVNATLPTMVLPLVASLRKDGLRKLLLGLGVLSALQKVSYSQASSFVVGRQQSPASHLWNVTRFNPIWAAVEATMGIAAVRDVMLDGLKEDAEGSNGVTTTGRKDEVQPRSEPALLENPLVYFLASYASILLRLTRFNLNDAMIRSTIFAPLFVKFLQAMHRDCLSDSPALITRFFGSHTMARLGSLAFPMYLWHVPIGMLFYKRAVATRLWGKVMPRAFFPVYFLIVAIFAHLTSEGFVKTKAVQRWAASIAQALSKLTLGMLQDHGLRATKTWRAIGIAHD